LHCLILLFSSPIQHREAEHVLEKARTLSAAGHTVTIFLLGDGVYNASAQLAKPGGAEVVAGFAGLNGVRITGCSTCFAMRSVNAEIPGAKIGGLEDLVDEIESADAVLNYTAEE
jgi:sulfur relay (sulfurtransferase) complex TusBCD TusD component (DsrE family)